MAGDKKVNTGTQYDDGKDDSTQTVNAPDFDTTELSILANMFMHSSYWFMMLSIILTGLDLTGLSWAAKQKDRVCRESAMTILSWIMERGNMVQLVDIARPRLGGSNLDLTAEYAVRIWDQLDRWLEKEVELIVEKLVGVDSVLEEMLRKILETIKTGDLVGNR